MPLSPELAVWLRAQGHGAVHALELGMAQAEDEEILARALQEGRIVVTADLDYTRLFALLRERVPGLILFRGGNFSEVQTRELLERVFKQLSPEEIEGYLIVIEVHRIRKRSLPLKIQKEK